jgi:hypothetical protein
VQAPVTTTRPNPTARPSERLKSGRIEAIGKVAILDEEGPLTLSVSDVTVTEGDTGEVDLIFDVALDEAPDPGESVIVDVATADGSAIAGEDYTAIAPSTLTSAAGETTKFVTVKGIGLLPLRHE